MKITVIGRGNVGGGLAKLWRDAGHEVQELGRDGGDASGADVVLVAVPSGAITDALGKVGEVKPAAATSALARALKERDPQLRAAAAAGFCAVAPASR